LIPHPVEHRRIGEIRTNLALRKASSFTDKKTE
jgi:hypothetical protein